jgi:hypothetical protein
MFIALGQAMRWAFLILFLMTPFLAQASCGEAATSHENFGDIDWRQERREINRLLRNPEASIKSLEISSAEIVTIRRKLGFQKVTSTGTVFSVKILQGRGALKFYDGANGPLERYFPGILIQHALRDSGFVPRTLGVLPRSQVQRLLSDFPELKAFPFRRIPPFAVLMEETVPVDSQFASLVTTAQKVRADFHAITLILSHLRLSPRDFQSEVAYDGHVKVHDLDFYEWFSEVGTVHNDAYPLGIELSKILIVPGYYKNIPPMGPIPVDLRQHAADLIRDLNLK